MPIVPLFASGFSGAIVADGNQVIAVHRRFSGNEVAVDYSGHESFATGKLAWRAREAIDFAVVPGQEASITRITATG